MYSLQNVDCSHVLYEGGNIFERLGLRPSCMISTTIRDETRDFFRSSYISSGEFTKSYEYPEYPSTCMVGKIHQL